MSVSIGKLWVITNPLAGKSAYKLVMATITEKGESTKLENAIKNVIEPKLFKA